MNISTENTTNWPARPREASLRESTQPRVRRLLLAGITGAVLLVGGAGLAYAGQQDAPAAPTSGYGTVVDEQGAPLPAWPDRVSTTEDCPGRGGADDGTEGGGSASPRQSTSPTVPDGEL